PRALPERTSTVRPFRREKDVIIGSSSGKVPKGTGGRTYEILEIIITYKKKCSKLPAYDYRLAI
ncbi:MAG: hypothetical protein MUO60_18975, partial [Clostridiaceae bacterium]|nr:hypothetical protein [Clostridiaceae bacterium]